MKCKLIRPMQAFNPEWNRDEAQKAKREGREYEHKQIITREPGWIQDHPDSWNHCVNGYLNAEPYAVPADEECREKVREWLANRPTQIRKLANILKQLPKHKHEKLREAYAVELHEVDPDYFTLGEPDDAEVYEEDEDD